MFKIRKSTKDDLPEILTLYQHAREEMKKNNNPHQWKDTEPRVENVIADISNGNHHILEKDGVICGAFSMLFSEDPTYAYIEGKWLNDLPYITIHKLASNNLHKGVLKAIIDYAFCFLNTVRIDTHEQNTIMRHLLDKYGFTLCGTIYLLNEEPRLAYQKTI